MAIVCGKNNEYQGLGVTPRLYLCFSVQACFPLWVHPLLRHLMLGYIELCFLFRFWQMGTHPWWKVLCMINRLDVSKAYLLWGVVSCSSWFKLNSPLPQKFSLVDHTQSENPAQDLLSPLICGLNLEPAFRYINWLSKTRPEAWYAEKDSLLDQTLAQVLWAPSLLGSNLQLQRREQNTSVASNSSRPPS